MLHKENLVLSHRKLPTWFMTPTLSNCINIKCKKEKD
jgi:hypothetical protein